jgi:hypothetical protein
MTAPKRHANKQSINTTRMQLYLQPKQPCLLPTPPLTPTGSINSPSSVFSIPFTPIDDPCSEEGFGDVKQGYQEEVIHELWSRSAKRKKTTSQTIVSLEPLKTHSRASDHRPATFSSIQSNREDDKLIEILAGLRIRGVDVFESRGQCFPAEAMMHDRAAVIPRVVVSPRDEQGVAEILQLLASLKLYDRYDVSVRSGGHGYSNEASCSGIMVNLARMTKRRIVAETLFLEPGCILGQLINTLVDNGKAVPHGDCFGVAAGGHFLTAGWDIALARRYGLGCQSVIGGRIVLWDGSIVEVDDKNHPELLYAMRGGAAAGVGIVTEIRLNLIRQPDLVSWNFQSLCRSELETCTVNQAFAAAAKLPRDISVSFRIYFEPTRTEPVCSFNVVSLLSAKDTMDCLSASLGSEVTSLHPPPSMWHEQSLLDLRMIPASEALSANPEWLAEITPVALHENPLSYWKPTTSSREMASSYFTSASHWVLQDCDSMFLELYDAFRTVPEPSRGRVYALVVQGGGQMTELQHQCSMPLGQSLARFEVHWDDHKDEEWSRAFAQIVSGIMKTKMDEGPSRPYRGDIWLKQQGRDRVLDNIFRTYNRRSG